MTELMLGLLLWIGANTDYTVTTALPNIVMTEKYNMCAAYGIGEKGRCDAARLHGFYDKNMTIYLRNGFDVANADDVSMLLHELVHYVQWLNGANRTTCLGMLEVEAYELQDAWRAKAGLGPGIDEFRKILLAASCDA